VTLDGLGVWTWLDGMHGPDAAAFVKKLEAWGYTALWVPEALGRDPFAFLGYLAAQTESIRLCTGIANIYARDAVSMTAAHKTLSDLSEGRFILGLGVSHGHLVAGVRGHDYSAKPVTTMRNYLEAMQKAMFQGVQAETGDGPILLAALRKNMLGLAASGAQGAHPYFVPPEHTARAREIMGPDALLAPEQKVLLCTDATKARSVARGAMKIYAGLPNYQNNLKWLGFEDDDFAGDLSDRLVDAIVAWGDEDAIRARIQAHYDAGANHVCIQAIHPDAGGAPVPHQEALELLAPARS
jgi:probable F420-dependent oxidoreductase